MDFFTPSTSTSSPSSSISATNTDDDTSYPVVWDGELTDERSSRASGLVSKVLRAVVTCVFTLVGSSVGAVMGAFIGLATESGFFRGAGVGAISGAVFSIEAVESSIALWHSNESPIWCVLYVIDILDSLLNGRIVQEKVGPAVHNAVQSQMSAVDALFIEDLDIFETGGERGMSKYSVDNLLKIKVTKENNVDASGEKMCCSVCLQDLQVAETVRSLPHCGHMFHLPCIDNWLIRHGSCPLCRRDLNPTSSYL